MAKRRILIVEDDQPLLEALAIKFANEDFEVFKAKDGQEGLDLAVNNCPDIILLDIIMPKMHGWQMLEKLREDQWGKEAKVIILSNVSDPVKIEEAKKTGGVIDYLVKTELKLEDVIKIVKERLGLN